MMSRFSGVLAFSGLLALSGVLMTGCPSAEQAPGSDNPWASPPGSDPATTNPPPVLDVAGGPGAPATNNSSSPSSDACQPAAYALEAHPLGGETVTLSGTVAGLTGQGSMIIELVRPDAKVSAYGFACPMSSDFSLPVPVGLGTVGVGVFVDSNGNGPDTADIAGRHSAHIEVGTEDISGLTITVSESPDLGDITPPFSMPNAPRDGQPPGEGEPPAAEDAPPGEGTPPAGDAPPLGDVPAGDGEPQ
ncbi:MAG: hypothetical protein ACI8RZ_004146 [Myxococcota bacterium]|jgi:hypothetical protein